MSVSNDNEDILFKISELEEQIKSSQKATAQLRQDLIKMIKILRSVEALLNYWRL